MNSSIYFNLNYPNSSLFLNMNIPITVNIKPIAIILETILRAEGMKYLLWTPVEKLILNKLNITEVKRYCFRKLFDHFNTL